MRFLFIALMLFCVIAGRIYTYDLTEGQALVEGAGFWIAALLWGFLAAYPFREKS